MSESEDAKLRAAVHRALDTEPGPSERVESDVFARIAASQRRPDHRDRPAGGRWERIAEWLRAPLIPRWAQVAAIALIVVESGLLLRGLAPNQVDITARAVAPVATRLRVTFESTTTEAQIRSLLVELQGRITDGPNSKGEYVVEVSNPDPKAVAAALGASRSMLRSIERESP
jgi:Arc/MetJ family transcription regulator